MKLNLETSIAKGLVFMNSYFEQPAAALSAMLAFCCLGTAMAAEAKSSTIAPEVVVDVDFYDHMTVAKHWYGLDFYGPKEIEDIFRNCKESGVSTVNWRAYCQIANYPSKINYTISDLERIRSSPDSRRSQGAFSARVGVGKASVGGICQFVDVKGKSQYVFTGDISSEKPGAYLAILDPLSKKIICASEIIKNNSAFGNAKLEFEHNGPFNAAVLANGGDGTCVFIADNLSLKDEAGKELLKNGDMEVPDMLQPLHWKQLNALFLFTNGDYRAATADIRRRYLPNADTWFEILDKPYAADLYQKTMNSCDTLAEAVKCARKYGIKIYAWIDPIDDGRVVLPPLSAWSSRFLEEHPEFRLVNKDGRTRWGMLCFGYPEVRKYKTDIVKELLEYGVDGITLKMNYQHNQVWDGNTYDYQSFLFNDVALEEYARTYGTPSGGDYDVRLLQSIYGDFFIQWLRELRPVILKSGKRLCLFKQPSKSLDQPSSGWKVDPVKIVNERLIDDLMLEPRMNKTYKGQFSAYDSVSGYSEACSRNNVKIGYDFHLNGMVEFNSNIKDKGSYMKEQLFYIAEEPVDFVGIYECIYIDKLKLWPYIKDFNAVIMSSEFKRKESSSKGILEDKMKGRKNLAAYAAGARATLIRANDKVIDANDMIDGDISDSSAFGIDGMPFEIVISFPAATAVHSFRIFHGMVSYAQNPSGECGIKSLSVEGFSDGRWLPLCDKSSETPRLNPDKDGFFSYNISVDLKSLSITKIKFTVLSSNDTGCRAGSSGNAIVPEKSREVFIREIEVF